MPDLGLSTAAWSEPPTTAVTGLARLVPYLTTDGWWLYLGVGDVVPVGALRGAVMDDGVGGVTLESPATGGLRPTANSGGTLFLLDA